MYHFEFIYIYIYFLFLRSLFQFKTFIHQSVVLHVIDTSFMSRTDGASWSHFLRASLTDTILEIQLFINGIHCTTAVSINQDLFMY